MTRTPRRTAVPQGIVVLIPFGLLFMMFALTMVCVEVIGIIRAKNMQSWVEVPARVLRVELKVDYEFDDNPYCDNGRKYTEFNVPDGYTSCRTTGEYVYSYQGRDYRGTEVSDLMVSGQERQFQEGVCRRLLQSQRSGQPVRCFVNPARPAEAVLVRDLDKKQAGLTISLGGVFAGMGAGLAALGVFLRQRAKRAEDADRQTA